MYTTRNRVSSIKTLSGSGKSGVTVIAPHMHTPDFLEGIYSWRTGVSNIADPPGSPPVREKRADGFGIIAPSHRGSLAHRLSEIKRYTEDVQRAAFPAETDAGTFSSNRLSTTDTGHPFGSIKVLRSAYTGYLDIKIDSTHYYQGDIWASSQPSTIYNQTPYTFGFPVSTASPLFVSSSGRQATANRYFAQTAPDRQTASLGVTLIELLRGDVPSLLKNFRNMHAGYKSAVNYIGKDALNVMFGWTPLIQEYANVIKTGMALERVVYYETFRRKRRWDGPSFSEETTPTVSIGTTNSPYQSASMLLAGSTSGGSSGYSVSYASQKRVMAIEDYHFSSKYTGLARAGRRANAFSDQAMDAVKRLGLVDDPRLLWDLTPYSWLVDWFTSMGDSISNAHVYAPISGKYTSDYAYLTTKHTATVEAQLLRRSGALPSSVKSHSLTSNRSDLTCISKWRSRATPFGFGTQLGSLNASQFAILTALGFTKVR